MKVKTMKTLLQAACVLGVIQGLLTLIGGAISAHDKNNDVILNINSLVTISTIYFY